MPMRPERVHTPRTVDAPLSADTGGQGLGGGEVFADVGPPGRNPTVDSKGRRYVFAAVVDEVTLFFLLACQTDRQRAEWGSEYLVPRDYHLPRVDTTIVLFGQVSSSKDLCCIGWKKDRHKSERRRRRNGSATATVRLL